MGKPAGFAAWVWQVWVQCQICQPTATLYPSQVTHGLQPPVPTLAHTTSHALQWYSKLHTLSYPHCLSPTLAPSPLPSSACLSPPSHAPSPTPCCLPPLAILPTLTPTPCHLTHFIPLPLPHLVLT